MFGHNEIVGKSFFRNVPEDTLTVTSRFFTLQGEGPYRGMPAYFIRLAKCNLACSFCDTYFDSGKVQTFDEIFADVDQVIDEFYSKRNIAVPTWAQYTRGGDQAPYFYTPRQMVLVMTGGEPTLQPYLGAFLERAQHVFKYTQIESNGTQGFDGPSSTTFVVSPKCNEKQVDGIWYATKYLQPNSKTLQRADCLKFVMSAPDDKYSPYSEVPEWAHKWAAETGRPIFVSPMNIYLKEPHKAKLLRAQKQDAEITIDERSNVDEIISFWEEGLLDMKANQRNHEYTAEYCMKYGFTLNLQIHLYASLP